MNEQQFNQLMGQAHRGDAPAVLAAVDNEPGLVTRGSEEHGSTLLHWACIGGQADLSRSLLDRKADVNQLTNRGWDALMAASAAGHCNVIELLTSRGADIDARSNAGWTALAYAAANDKYPACLCLISKKADLMAVDNKGRSALDVYGLFAAPPLSDEVKNQRCESLRTAWAEGPHISQGFAMSF
jgi:26S proteasome non-ATPase regulatory subunit 10